MVAEQLATPFLNLEQAPAQVDQSFEQLLTEKRERDIENAEQIIEENERQSGESLPVPLSTFERSFPDVGELFDIAEHITEYEHGTEIYIPHSAVAERNPALIEIMGERQIEHLVTLTQDENGGFSISKVDMLIDWDWNVAQESESNSESEVAPIWSDSVTVSHGPDGVSLVGSDGQEMSLHEAASVNDLNQHNERIQIILGVIASGESYESYSAYLQEDGNFLLSTTVYSLDENGNVIIDIMPAETISYDHAAELYESGTLQRAIDLNENMITFERELEKEEESSSDDELFVEDVYVPEYEIRLNAESTPAPTPYLWERITTTRVQLIPGSTEWSASEKGEPTTQIQSMIRNTGTTEIAPGELVLRISQKAKPTSEDPENTPPNTMEAAPSLYVVSNENVVATGEIAMLKGEVAHDVVEGGEATVSVEASGTVLFSSDMTFKFNETPTVTTTFEKEEVVERSVAEIYGGKEEKTVTRSTRVTTTQAAAVVQDEDDEEETTSGKTTKKVTRRRVENAEQSQAAERNTNDTRTVTTGIRISGLSQLPPALEARAIQAARQVISKAGKGRPVPASFSVTQEGRQFFLAHGSERHALAA